MRVVHQKQIKYLLLFSFFFVFISGYDVVAKENSGKGKMQIRTDLIHGKDNDSESLSETELDRIFPELFDEEIQEKLAEVQVKQQNNLEHIQNEIFTNDFKTTTPLKVKDGLFHEAYESNLANESEEETKTSDIVSLILFYGSIGVFILIIGGVAYILGKKIESE